MDPSAEAWYTLSFYNIQETTHRPDPNMQKSDPKALGQLLELGTIPEVKA